MKRFWIISIALCMCLVCGAAVSLPGIYSSHMVLEQSTSITLHGQARANKTVTLTPSWADNSYSAKADKAGLFTLTFTTPKAGGPYTMTFSDGQKLTLEDVYIGEVWLGSGQSNMEMPVAGWGKILNYEQEIASASYPMIRLFQVKRCIATSPASDVVSTLDGWQPCSPATVPEFSALGYRFALELYNRLHIPVGFIHSSWGGTPGESWTSPEAISQVQGFEQLMKTAVELGFDTAAMRQRKLSSPDRPSFPSVLFNGMIAPLTDFPIAGVVWYQGCFNVGRDKQYKAIFPTLIADWRRQFNLPDMPFYFVQLANYLEPSDLQPDSKWAALREAQDAALALPNTHRVTNIELGDAHDIHPKNKQELARRMALQALRYTYHVPVTCVAPEYAGYRIVGSTVYIDLCYPDGALPLVDQDNAPGFILAGPDWQWHVAKARCHDGQITVWCDEVEYPVAVRYGWADNPTCTLVTPDGIPLAPFRTDK